MRMSFYKICFLVAIAANLSLVFISDIAAQVWATESGHAAFVSSMPLFEFTGESEYLAGRISFPDSTLDFYLDLESLKTGIGKRDKDMRQTLGTNKNPFAEFYGRLHGAIDPTSDNSYPVTAVGDFSINGVTRPVTITGEIKVSGETLILSASWILRLGDYNIEPPKLLIFKVDEDQRITITATLQRISE